MLTEHNSMAFEPNDMYGDNVVETHVCSSILRTDNSQTSEVEIMNCLEVFDLHEAKSYQTY